MDHVEYAALGTFDGVRQVARPNGVFGVDFDVTPEESLVHEERPRQFTMPHNATGQPAISLPLAHHGNGLPSDAQVGARPAEEHVLIQIAAALDEATPWRGRVPRLHVAHATDGACEAGAGAWGSCLTKGTPAPGCT